MEKKRHYRHELKYDITYVQYLELIPRLKAIAQSDGHVGEDGKYLIHSVYFDNYKDKALREKTDGVQKREKFRIRWYNDDTDHMKLEKKQKDNNLCLKYGTKLSKDEFDRIIKGDVEWMKDSDDELKKEFYIKTKALQLKPRVLVSYTREPYIYAPGNVRITFDSEIRTSLYHQFSSGGDLTDIDARMEPGHMILEVKYDNYLPEIISMIIQMGTVRQSAFSKYGICRRFG